MNDRLDRIRGSLIGGAIGDALGYAVEFDSYREIVKKYGKNGITDYKISKISGKAAVSDDTQMTLFTAEGILKAETQNLLNGTKNAPTACIWDAYKDWYATQSNTKAKTNSWLYAREEMHKLRAPGTTCLNALSQDKGGTTDAPINDSKGCGGIMRVAPLGLYYADELTAARYAADAAALTHGHPMGYMSAAVMAYMVSAVVKREEGDGRSLAQTATEAARAVSGLYANGYAAQLEDLVEKAIEFTNNDRSDEQNIRILGGGWVGEEALAVAVYCAVKYGDNFEKAMIAAVNHGGDSDSTGAIAGNILGAWLGYARIEEKWKGKLDIEDILEEMASDLNEGCSEKAEWLKKYGK